MTSKNRQNAPPGTPRRAGRLVLASLVLVTLNNARADYLELYWNGREAYRNEKYRESVVYLDRAIKLQPRGGERVRWTGTHFETYLPHFHLGRALYELGQYDQALAVWGEAERQGDIRDKGNRQWHRELQKRLKALDEQALPEELERLRRDVSDTADRLVELQTRGIGGLVAEGDELGEVSSLLDEALRTVQSASESPEAARLGQAGRALDQARERLLRALDGAERRRRETERRAETERFERARAAVAEAAALLSDGGCRPRARALLLEVLAGGALPRDLREGPFAVPRLLSRAHERCGDLLGAEQFLELTGDADELNRVAAARRQRMLERIDVDLAEGGCNVTALAQLEELSDDVPVGDRLQRAESACGLPAPTDVAGQENLLALAKVRVERSRERALSTYLLARSTVDRRGCDRQAVDAMVDAMQSPFLEADSPGSVQPFLDLARAYQACGDREQTEWHLERARQAEQGTREEHERLDGWLERTRALDVYSESHALLVGVADYDDERWGALPEVLEDLAAVEEELRDHGFAVEKLTDPSHDELTRVLKQFFGRKRRPDSRLVFYYGGHGHTEINDYLRLGYIVPADTPFPEGDAEAKYLPYLVSMDGFEGYATGTAANHVMFLFDSCFSGTIFDATGSRLGKRADVGDDPRATLRRPVRLFVTAGDETEQVPAESTFRAAVVRALQGFADSDTDGLIFGAEVGDFVARHGATLRNTPKWGTLTVPGFDGGDMAFRIPDFEVRAREASVSDTAAAAEQALWRLANESPQPDDLREYIERYPDGQFVDAARWMLRRRSR